MNFFQGLVRVLGIYLSKNPTLWFSSFFSDAVGETLTRGMAQLYFLRFLGFQHSENGPQFDQWSAYLVSIKSRKLIQEVLLYFENVCSNGSGNALNFERHFIW